MKTTTHIIDKSCYCYECLLLKDKKQARSDIVEYEGYVMPKYSILTRKQTMKRLQAIKKSSIYKQLVDKFTFHPTPKQIATVFINLSREDRQKDLKTVIKLVRQKLIKLSPYQ